MDTELKQWISGDTCSVSEAAHDLGVSRGTILNMISEGVLIAWRPNPRGRKFRLYRQQVERVAVTAQSEAIKYANLMSVQLDLF